MGSRPALVACPRDALQGVSPFIPTAAKVAHLRAHAEAGVSAIDFASFVSPKAVPQMADAEAVAAGIAGPSGIDWIAVVLNAKGAGRAAGCAAVRTLGFPLSLSDAFQRANGGTSAAEGLSVLREVGRRAGAAGRDLLAYASMGFGNPYGEPWSVAMLGERAGEIAASGARRIALADTAGCGTPGSVRAGIEAARRAAPGASIGVHLHALPGAWRSLVDAALEAGIDFLDAAAGGLGGCPFTGKEMLANLPLEEVAPYLEERGIATGLSLDRLPALAREGRALVGKGPPAG